MPVLWIAGLAAAGVAAFGAGVFAKDTSQAIDTTSNATLKFAAAGVAVFLVAKHYKVI